MTDIRQLKAFVAVAEELNFHRAAEKLGTVQPALSRVVRKLETDLEVKLFERTTRHVALTETGKLFLEEARGLIAQLASAVRAAQSVEKGQSGTLRLAYMDFAVHALLPGLLSSVARAGPGIDFELTYLSSAQQRLALMEGKIDMGMMIGQMNSPFVECLRLADEKLTVVLPSRHRLSSRKSVRLAELLGESVLLGNQAEWSAFREIVFRLYAAHGASPRLTMEAASAPALFGMVAQGMGISFYGGVPEIYRSSYLAFRPLVPIVTVQISLVWRKGAKLALVRQALKAAGWSKS